MQKIQWNSSNGQLHWFLIDFLWISSKMDQTYPNANASRPLAKFFKRYPGMPYENWRPAVSENAIHGWKAMDLSFNLAPSYRYLKHPTSRQNFEDTPGQTLRHKENLDKENFAKKIHLWSLGSCAAFGWWTLAEPACLWESWNKIQCCLLILRLNESDCPPLQFNCCVLHQILPQS